MTDVVQTAAYLQDRAERDGCCFDEEGKKLNRYLQMAQNLYIAITGEKLFSEDLYAYPDGAAVPALQGVRDTTDAPLPPETYRFLDQVCMLLRNASQAELDEMSKEDPAWKETGGKMDSLSHAGEYRILYRDALRVMERFGMPAASL